LPNNVVSFIDKPRIYEEISYTFIPKGNCEKGKGEGREFKPKLGKT
jgi:hypothetical protein